VCFAFTSYSLRFQSPEIFVAHDSMKLFFGRKESRGRVDQVRGGKAAM
jgi:hypothetical protein